MNKPVLVIMAAGMGSRFGGMKQTEPVDEQGHILMDFSIFDAKRAGFEKVVFIIRREFEQIFRERIGDRIGKQMEVVYAYQDVHDLPDGYTLPEGREKPWGTAHAVLSARDVIDGPFAVINADDYYGREAFTLLYDYLTTHGDDEKYRYTMVSYILENTLTEHGSVARGICTVSDKGFLEDVHERTKIIRTENGAAYSEDDGSTWTDTDPQSLVSLNTWGFTKSFLRELADGFPAFLDGCMKTNPMKGEYYLPSAVDRLLKEGKATVEVLKTHDRWFGMTYREDREMVAEQIRMYKENGVYPQNF